MSYNPITPAQSKASAAPAKIRFGKIFWPSLWAALIVSVIGLLIWFFMIRGFINALSQDAGLKVKDNTVLHMSLNGPIAEKSQSKFDPISMGMVTKIGLADILHGFEQAKDDDKIKGIYLELEGAQCGYATAREIRKAINDFEKAGKWVMAYNSGEVVSLKQYYIASAADKNYGFPSSNFEFLGLGTEMTFYKNTLEKLDVEMQVIRGSGNDFKSAVEPFLRDNMSDSSRVQVEQFLSSMWLDIRKEIATDRKTTPEKLDQLAEEALVRDIEDAVKYKLVDGVKYKDEILKLLAKKAGTKKGEELELLSFSKYAKKRFYQNQTLSEADEPNIAVILAEGGVSRSGDGLTSEQICKLFRDVRANKSIKTIVFRINSPGGSALASDEIWREVKLTNKTKKVIVSMGDVAASGGYYIAAPATAIFAEPTTITGSIGVFGVIPYTGDMLENKLGFTFDRAETNAHSILTTNERLTEEEMKIIQESVDDIYDDFKSIVAEGRGMTKAQVQAIARGRVWTGRDAKKIGLIDELGGLKDAIAYAAKKSKIREEKILYYPKVKKDALGDFIEQLEAQEKMSIKSSTPELPASIVVYYNQLRELESFQGIQMRLPFTMTIK